MATVGANSDDPRLRRASQTYLAVDARNQIVGHQERQTAALESMAHQEQPVPAQVTATPRVDASLADGMRFLKAVEHFYAEDPPQIRKRLYLDYPERWLGLSGEGSRFALGAVHTGYSSRRAEESLYFRQTAPIPLVHGLLVEVTSSRGFDDYIASACVGAQFAREGMDIGIPLSEDLDVFKFSYPDLHLRESHMRTLNLLTNPPAVNRNRKVRRVQEVNSAQVDGCVAIQVEGRRPGA